MHPPLPPPAPLPSPPPPPARDRFGRWRGRAWLLLALLPAGVWGVGLVRFLRAHPFATVTLPRRAPPPAAPHNLASYRYGPTVRVSSYDRNALAPHHPTFLVDERSLEPPSAAQRAGAGESWISGIDDRRPWIEITWREPHDLERVVVKDDGAAASTPDSTLASRGYTASCLREVGDDGVARDGGPARARAVLSPPCRGARGVHLEARAVADRLPLRIWEIEAWGR